MSQATNTLETLLAGLQGSVPENDIVHMFVPLMNEVAQLHEQGKIAQLHPSDIIENKDGSLTLAKPEGQAIQANPAGLSQIQPKHDSALNIVGNISLSNDSDDDYFTDLEVLNSQHKDGALNIEKPLYVSGYISWEDKINHHDELTDVFCLGLCMAAAACHLDLNDKADLTLFSQNRSNLYRINSRIHPAIATLIEGMTALNRHERDSNMHALALRLEKYRDQLGRFNPEQVIENIKEVPSRRSAILSNLRDRLFDLSKRNRLVHFKSSQNSVNMTVASVPLVMRLESIRKEQLCTWGNSFSTRILSGKVQALGNWLRFEDQPYLPAAINRLIAQSRRDKAEYGFSSLRLVIGFLNWYNLKEAPNDKITSPLLWLSVDVKKKKGVRDQYLIQCHDSIAEFNPALRHYLKQLYDIDLPEEVDLNEVSIDSIHQQIAAQIAQTEADVKLALTRQPSIRLIHQKAVKRLRNFDKRRGKLAKQQSQLANFSYEQHNYKPLGRTIFEQHIQLRTLPQRTALGQSHKPQQDFASGVQGNTAQSDTYVLDKGNRGKYDWEIDLAEVTLANFNYKKMSLVRDYSALIEQAQDLQSLDRLFSIQPKQEEAPLPQGLPISQQWSVVPSDMTQDQAVALAREGESFIIQGPPGTGKSQTITNLIADFAAQGKRVLFVCEKRAALDVVFNRLKQAGLEKLACIIHDIQEDKKPFIHDLKSVYEEWFASSPQAEQHQAHRKRTLTVLNNNLTDIEKLETILSSLPEDECLSVRALIRAQLALPNINNNERVQAQFFDAKIREQLPSLQAWQSELSLAKHIQMSMREQFGEDSLAGSVFAQLHEDLVLQERATQDRATHEGAYTTISNAVEQTEKLSDKLTDACDVLFDVLDDSHSLHQMLNLTALASTAVALNLHNFMALFGDTAPITLQLNNNLEQLAQKKAILTEKQQNCSHWQQVFSPQDTATALALATQKESSLFRIFSGEWRALKKAVEAQYNFSAHAVRPTICSILHALSDMHEAAQAYNTMKQEIASGLHTTSLDELLDVLQQLKVQQRSNPLLASIIQHEDSKNQLSTLAVHKDILHEFVQQLTTLIGHNVSHAGFFALQSTIRDMRESLDDLPILLPLLQASFKAPAQVGFVLRQINADVPHMQALITDEALQRSLRKHPELAQFDIDKLNQLSKRSAKARNILLSQNAENIVVQRHDLFTQHVRHSTLSVSQLNTQEREFKKFYSAGRREVEHEFSKSMRYRSIRDMASDETGAVVSDLKPIWLMSPLSVSDTLPMQSDLFDVVIFDEASQIPVEDGIPALCRAPQLIVVGDEMQLPPTSFFSSSIDEDDMEIEVEEDGEVLSVLLDADSLLAQAARHLPATLLAWHYRSRSEALISFSNAAFYDGRLVTIPDQVRFHGQTDKSDKTEKAQTPELHTQASSQAPAHDQKQAQAHCAALLNKPLSFHFIEDGVYQQRCNNEEATAIAFMVRDLLLGEHNHSIGIVAFSEAQQSCIEDALDTLAEDDHAFAASLEEEYQREDEDQFNGLFIKNLENVQGDERDVIILSICYAPGPSGKMLMNFGPINQRGGEKRLNVIFSRARKHMAVVSSIRANAITNTHNDGAFALRTFLAFAESQNKGDTDASRLALSQVNPNVLNVFSAKPPQDPMRTAIAKALREKDYEVHEYVGSASFRCDLAIVDKQSGNYSLAILLDHQLDHQRSAMHDDSAQDSPQQDSAEPGESMQRDARQQNVASNHTTPNSNHAFERYVFKPTILKAFGWKVIDVFTSHWQQSPQQVIASIEYALQHASVHQDISEEALFEHIELPSFQTNAGNTLQANANAEGKTEAQNGAQLAYEFQKFRFVSGKSDKFWHIAKNNTDLILQYGRSGTKGQTMTKSFDTEKQAQQQMNRLIREKVNKGYEDAS